MGDQVASRWCSPCSIGLELSRTSTATRYSQPPLSTIAQAIGTKPLGGVQVFLCCSAILQNVSESHYRSGARNQLQGTRCTPTTHYAEQRGRLTSVARHVGVDRCSAHTAGGGAGAPHAAGRREHAGHLHPLQGLPHHLQPGLPPTEQAHNTHPHPHARAHTHTPHI